MINPEEIPHLLQSVEYFRGLSTAQIQFILRSGSIRTLQEGDIIFHEEEPCSGLFVLIEGQVHLHKLGPDGNFTIMRVLQPVTMFNEVAALDGGRNPATVVATVHSTVWQVARENFFSILVQFPEISIGLLKMMAAHNRHLVGQYQDLTTRPVTARCAKLLFELSEGGTRPINRRQHPSHLMAARIATVPELFSRGLKSLKEAAAIEVTSRLITVTNPQLLAHLAQITQTHK